MNKNSKYVLFDYISSKKSNNHISWKIYLHVMKTIIEKKNQQISSPESKHNKCLISSCLFALPLPFLIEKTLHEILNSKFVLIWTYSRYTRSCGMVFVAWKKIKKIFNIMETVFMLNSTFQTDLLLPFKSSLSTIFQKCYYNNFISS